MTVLGKYELLEGESIGGQAKVLAGRRLLDGKPVAIKVIMGTGNESEKDIANDLYELELGILKKLRGVPNVIQLLDYGFDEHLKENVIILEWMATSLADRLERTPGVMTENEWINLSRKLISSVSKAHSRSIAHRDIKPANIMFRTNSPTDWDCVLIDFGISKFVGFDEVDPNLTMREYRTPAYSSVNYLEEEDFSRDIFGLSAVMIRLRVEQDFGVNFTVQDAIKHLMAQPNINPKYIPVLKQGVEPDSSRRYKTIKEFNSSLAGQGSSNSPSSSTKFFTLVLSAEARQQLADLQAETISREYADLKGLLKEQIYLRLPKDSDPNSTSERFNLQVGFLDLKCKGPSSDSRNPHSIYVRDIKEIDQNDMEFKVQHSKVLSQSKFGFSLEADVYGRPQGQFATYLDYVNLVANPAQPKELKLDEKIASKVSKWEAILDAKEEFILGKGVKTQFELIDSQYKSLTLRPVGAEDIEFTVQSSWGLEGAAGIQLVLDYQDEDGSLYFTSNRDIRNFPAKGVIYPTLGENAPSFRRQKQALQSIKEHGEDLGNWVQVVVDPQMARTSPIQQPIEYFDDKLDNAKRAALKVALEAEDIALVQGPPGTGKTSFIVELIKQNARSGSRANKILLVSQTHIAVDNALERLHKSGHVSLLRVGRDEKVSPETRSLLIEKRLGDWQAQVEKSSFEFLKVLIENLGCDFREMKILKALNRLRELRFAKPTLVQDQVQANLTTFAQQVDETLQDAGIQNYEEVQIDFDALGQEEKELIFELQELGLDRNQVLNAQPEELSAEIELVLNSGKNVRKAWALSEVQAKWIRLFKSDDHLKKTYVSRTQVIAGTCIGFLGDQYAREMEFDLCIIDEASKATATEILVPMSRSRKTILVGDTNQLPPTEEQMTRDEELMKKHELTIEDVEVTLFETLAKELPQASQKMLTRQYRMLPVIGDLISNVFYKGRVESEPREVPDWVKSSWGSPLQFIDTTLQDANRHDEVGTSVRNRLEARLAVQQVGHLLANLSFADIELTNLRIVVLAPYAAQVTEIKHTLNKYKIGAKQVEVMTFDSAQGIECDFAIVTATRSGDPSSSRQGSTGRFGFISKTKWKRINVGLSRARFGLAIIGNRGFLRDGSGFADVIAYLERTGAEIRNAEIEGGTLRSGQ